ncbi:MAG: AraC family transcriptional regulator, partial [Clostridiales bacterium]|nr:AraC family transcriptional regulator [Clostridiales bacterium]
MKRYTKLMALALVLVMTGSLVVGCGQASTTGQNASNQASSAAAATPADQSATAPAAPQDTAQAAPQAGNP